MKNKLSKILILSLLASLAAPALHAAEEAPAPRRMPRTPVSQEMLAQQGTAPMARQIQGTAAIIDGEKLRVGNADLRLFGIVPPQLSASFGPQARALLDQLANGQTISCMIRDRDRDGRLLATCHNASNADMALELLKRGLAVTARGSIAGTEVAIAYLSAEQLAQSEKIGLWSVTNTSVQQPAKPEAKPEVKAEVALPTPTITESDAKRDDKAASPRADKTTETQMQAKIAADIVGQQRQTQMDNTAWVEADNVGFFERYQILIAGILMLGTALSIIAALWMQKARDRRDEMKAMAAALRGELMAARSVCLGRAKEITSEAEDRAANWPRIRATLYQAYVGRIGLLGADLARTIASLYGQSSDYAALYAQNGEQSSSPKKYALEMLAHHIEDVLPKLAVIEKTGHLSATTYAHPQAMPQKAQAAPTAEQTPGPQYTEQNNGAAMSTADIYAAHRSPTALWENVRGFLQSHRNAVIQENPEPQPDPLVSEYAAMIEADMARYQFGTENVETLDISPQKKRG